MSQLLHLLFFSLCFCPTFACTVYSVGWCSVCDHVYPCMWFHVCVNTCACTCVFACMTKINPSVFLLFLWHYYLILVLKTSILWGVHHLPSSRLYLSVKQGRRSHSYAVFTWQEIKENTLSIPLISPAYSLICICLVLFKFE